ncbi:MAG: YigZ family protein [Clostridia bacterium]|nr:YigZ family protein [Clostridia bacterium]
MTEYRTVGREAADEFTVKKSRFIGYAKPVTTLQEATDFIAQIKSKHWDATHNVYAYCLREGQLSRYSDDGEPQGTAGMPALDVLKKEGVTDCVVVCTRYFGGIMLGAGGLVRAYSHTAKIALDAAGIVTMSLCTVAEVVCDYPFYGRLMPLLAQHGAVTADTAFADVVCVTFHIPADRYDRLAADVTDRSNGRVGCTVLEERFGQV